MRPITHEGVGGSWVYTHVPTHQIFALGHTHNPPTHGFLHVGSQPCLHPQPSHQIYSKMTTVHAPSIGLYRLVLEYCGWYTANTLITSGFNALSIGGGIVAAVE